MHSRYAAITALFLSLTVVACHAFEVGTPEHGKSITELIDYAWAEPPPCGDASLFITLPPREISAEAMPSIKEIYRKTGEARGLEGEQLKKHIERGIAFSSEAIESETTSRIRIRWKDGNYRRDESPMVPGDNASPVEVDSTYIYLPGASPEDARVIGYNHSTKGASLNYAKGNIVSPIKAWAFNMLDDSSVALLRAATGSVAGDPQLVATGKMPSIERDESKVALLVGDNHPVISIRGHEQSKADQSLVRYSIYQKDSQSPFMVLFCDVTEQIRLLRFEIYNEQSDLARLEERKYGNEAFPSSIKSIQYGTSGKPTKLRVAIEAIDYSCDHEDGLFEWNPPEEYLAGDFTSDNPFGEEGVADKIATKEGSGWSRMLLIANIAFVALLALFYIRRTMLRSQGHDG